MEESKLAGAISRIVGKMSAVKKGGHNDFHGYDYIREADVLSALRPLLAEEGIAWIPTVDPSSIVWHDESDIVTLIVSITVKHAASGETIGPITFPGCGQDKGDKAIYKAMTGATKYALMKLFLVESDDDPENERTIAETERTRKPRQQSRKGAAGDFGKRTESTASAPGDVPAQKYQYTRPPPPYADRALKSGKMAGRTWLEIAEGSPGGQRFQWLEALLSMDDIRPWQAELAKWALEQIERRIPEEPF
jgi:hypothetical protein